MIPLAAGAEDAGDRAGAATSKNVFRQPSEPVAFRVLSVEVAEYERPGSFEAVFKTNYFDIQSELLRYSK